MTIYSYEISKISVHNIHNEKEIEIEYLRLIFYCKTFKRVPSLGIPRRTVVGSWAYCRGIPGHTRPIRTQNAGSLKYMIFFYVYYAIEFCPFPFTSMGAT